MKQTIFQLCPVHEHPPKGSIIGIYRIAREHTRALNVEFRDSNRKARLIRANLSPEQLWIYEWISYVFTILGVGTDVFARQVGCTAQTVRGWLRKNGHLPNRKLFRRLLEIYAVNFLDKRALEYLHGTKIGLWREQYKPVWEKMAEKVALEEEIREERRQKAGYLLEGEGI